MIFYFKIEDAKLFVDDCEILTKSDSKADSIKERNKNSIIVNSSCGDNTDDATINDSISVTLVRSSGIMRSKNLKYTWTESFNRLKKLTLNFR